MTNQEKLAKMTPEECYKVLSWLFTKYAMGYTSSEIAIIDWLRSETSMTLSLKPLPWEMCVTQRCYICENGNENGDGFLKV